jgi:folate-dependent phosphoribosylglycinamide formyltransferase PurN
MIRTVILAPIHNSLYARLLANTLTKEEGIELCGIAVRSHWNLKRVHGEFGRDGMRLVKKVVDKYLLGDERFSGRPSRDNLYAAAEKAGLGYKSLKDIARTHQIPYRQVADFNHPDSIAFLRDQAPRIILFTGGGLIRKDLLAVPELGVLNCHSGILPEYRGMDVVEWTAAEENIQAVGFGATLHFMDNGVDTGPILLARLIDSLPGDTFTLIRDRIEALMLDLMLEGVKGLRDGKISARPQAITAGRQYYVMHPRMRTFAQKNLEEAAR